MAVFTVIDHTEIGSGGAASWTKASIPASYDHLYLLGSLRTERADYWEDGKVNLNGDTGNNYSYTRLKGGSGGATSSRNDGLTRLEKWNMSGASALADTFGPLMIWIPNYAGTVGYTQILLNTGASGNTTTSTQYSLGWYAGVWSSTAAVDEITIATNDGEDLAQYSTITLYGVTGA
jgi:hypothetical protein